MVILTFNGSRRCTVYSKMVVQRVLFSTNRTLFVKAFICIPEDSLISLQDAPVSNDEVVIAEIVDIATSNPNPLDI